VRDTADRSARNQTPQLRNRRMTSTQSPCKTVFGCGSLMSCLLCSIFILVLSSVSGFASFTRRRGTNTDTERTPCEGVCWSGQTWVATRVTGGCLRLAREFASGGPARSTTRACAVREGSDKRHIYGTPLFPFTKNYLIRIVLNFSVSRGPR